MSTSLASLCGRFLSAVVLLAVTTVTTAAGAGGERVNLNGVSIYYTVQGQGEPLLLLHGGLGHSGAWAAQLPLFSQHFRVITMDSRGHGHSSFDATPISYAGMAADVIALLDHLEIARTHVVGWSDGGIIGLELAIHHPQRLARLVAYGANYQPDGVREDIGENERFSRFAEEAAAEYQQVSPAPERWQAFVDNISAMWVREPHYSDEQMGNINTPVLVIAGLEEEAIKIPHVRATAALIPNAKLILVAGSGHFLHQEKPLEFNTAVLDFLR